MEGQKEFWGRLEAAVQAKLYQLTESNRALQQRIFDLHTIFEISKQLNSILELEKLLEEILSTCVEHASADSAAIVVAAPGEESLSQWRVKGSHLQPDMPAVSAAGHLVESLLRKKKALSFSEMEEIL